MSKGRYFRVLFGEDLPDGIRKICCAGGDWKLLFMRDCADNLLEGFGKLLESSVAVGQLVDTQLSPRKKVS